MVLMKKEWPLFINRAALTKKIRDSISECQLHSLAFARRICDDALAVETGLATALGISDDTAYGGFPEVASLGYQLASSQTRSEELELRFLDGIKRQQNRSEKALEALSSDDVALLGIADGISAIRKYFPESEMHQIQEWLLDLINKEPKRNLWTSRLRDLAGDLLDRLGRLRTPPPWSNLSSATLELVLRASWPNEFIDVELPSRDVYKEIFTDLMKRGMPTAEQVEEITVWIRSFDLLVQQNSESLFPRSESEKIAISMLEAIKEKFDLLAHRNTRIRIAVGLLIIIPVWTGLFLVKESLPKILQDRFDFLVGFVSLIGAYLYYALTQREINPKEIYSQMYEKQKLILYRRAGFDIEKYNKLVSK